MGVSSPDVSATPPEREIPELVEKGIDEKGVEELDTDEDQTRTSSLIDPRKELYDSTVIDPVLARKMTLVNNAIDEIGMTPFQWKLFFLNGFGYAVDSVRMIKKIRHALADYVASDCLSINCKPRCCARVW
jgi:hypothetical protein